MRDARSWTHAALFGSLWGAAEVSLGTVLKAAQVPLSGMVMAGIGVLCLLTARRLQPNPGVCLAAGAVAAFLKVFSVGGLIIGPVAGILAEAALVELAMTATRTSAFGAVLGGALAFAEAPLQMALTAVVIAGPDAKALARVVGSVIADVPFLAGSPAALVASVSALAAVLGALVGAASWRVAGRVARRLGAAP